MGKKKPEELYDGLDPYQLDQLKADLEKWRQKMPRPAPAAPPVSTFGDKMGAVGDTLKKGFWRGMENLSRFGEGAAWLPIQALKLPGSINQAVGGAPGLTDRVKQGATNIESELRHGTQFFQEKAGVPKEEHWYPTSERMIPTWAPEMAGQFTQPGPMLSPIKKLLSKEAIKPALKGMAQMGTYGAGLSAVEQFNKPEQEQDWSAVPKSAAMMAAGSPIFQRLAGGFAKGPRTAKPANATDEKVDIGNMFSEASPDSVMPEGFQGPLPRYAGQGPAPIETYYTASNGSPGIEDISKFSQGYKGPIAETARPGVAVQSPYNIAPPKVLPEIPVSLPQELAINAGPKLYKSPNPKLEPPPKTLTEPGIDALAGQTRPTLVKPHDFIPDQLEVNTAARDPFLVKRPTDQMDAFMAGKFEPGVRTLPNPTEMPSKQIASMPRHQLPPELNADMVNRAAFARETMGMQGQERGFNTMGEAGSSVSPTFKWYKDVTIDGGMKPSDVEKALAKIEQDHGADTGKYVERVKAALLNDPEFAAWQKSYGMKHPLLEAQAEWNVVPDEAINPHDLPANVLPPLEDTWQNPMMPLRASEGGVPKGHEVSGLSPGSRGAQQEIAVPPPTIGQRPIIGREVSPLDDAPLFSKSAQSPDPVQHQLGYDPNPYAPTSSGKPELSSAAPVSPVPDIPTGREAAREVSQEVAHDTGTFQKLSDILNDERGSTHLGGGVGPIERVLTQRRFAEKHPQDFGPVYRSALDRFEWAAAQKHDLTQLGRSYFLLEPSDRGVVDKILRDRRRGKPVQIPPALQPAVDAVDRMMQSSRDLINDVRAVKGMAPIPQDVNYVPFARSGDYLTIATAPNGSKWVSAATTLREAEAMATSVEAQIRQQFPGSTPSVMVKTTSSKKGDLPALDFGTMAMLEKAGLLSTADYEKAIEQFDLPPGFGAHFKHAQKILGESKDLLDPINRYIDGVTNYTARFLHDDHMKELIDTIKDPAVRQYSEHYREYLNTKPQEYSRLRGGVAVWDLAMNAGSIFQNATQVPLLGIPTLQRSLGFKGAVKAFKDGIAAYVHPTQEYLDVLQMAEREGHIKPVNAEELFGARGGPAGQELQFGSPYVQRQIEKGWLPAPVGKAIRGGLDAAAGGVENLIGKGGDASLAIGQKLSYAMHRLTGSSAPVAADKALSAHPVLMQGFAGLEEMNRKVSILQGYIAGKMQGLNPAAAYEFAKTYSRDVNFDYSPASRAELFRGAGAPAGLFMTFQTEYMATISKMIREQLKGTPSALKIAQAKAIQMRQNPPGSGNFVPPPNDPIWKRVGGPATTVLGAFWTLAGMKGIPGLDDLDLYGPDPGMLSQNLPDWAWHGPVSTATGFDVAAKFKLGPRVPYDMLHGSVDLSQIPVAQPFVNTFQATDWFLKQPKDAPNTQKYIERLLPPAARSLAQAGRWAGMGPAGDIEDGTVGTIKGHTPGPTEDGKRDFFHPDAIDTLGKAFTFTPLELSKQYTRGRIQQQLQDRKREATTKLTNTAAHNLDMNGSGVHSPALVQLQKEHPLTYRELMKAHALKRSGREQGSTEEIYRKLQEPKIIKR